MFTTLRIGDRIEYNIGNEKEPRWLLGRVINVGKYRVRISLDDYSNNRNTTEEHLRKVEIDDD